MIIIPLPYQVDPHAEPSYNYVLTYPKGEERRVLKLVDFSLEKIQGWVLLPPAKSDVSRK